MKFSKNLKKIRTAKNMSQDVLAKKLYVTRQTVSSWETGRTQPDLETLTKLAEIFEIDIEILIYGENRFGNEEDYIKAKRKLIAVISSILATSLVTVGAVLIFITGWESLSDIIQNICSLLPVLAGQIFAFLVLLKRKDSPLLRECASIAWAAGEIASTALFGNAFNDKIGSEYFVLAAVVMLLPIIFILDAASPLAVYYIGSVYFYCCMLFYDEGVLKYLILAVFIAAGLIFTISRHKRINEPQSIIAVWLSLIAVFASLIAVQLQNNETISIIVLETFAFLPLCLYLFERGKIKTKPFENSGLIMLCILTVTTGIMSPMLLEQVPSAGNLSLSAEIMLIISRTICTIVAIICFIINFKMLKQDILRIIYCVSAFLFFTLPSLPFINSYLISWLLSMFFAVIMALCIVAMGVMRTNFFLLNLGLITVIVLIIALISGVIGINLLIGGVMLILLGGVLFGVNIFVTKRAKLQKQEVQTNEEQ